MFGAYAVTDGFANIVGAVRHEHRLVRRWLGLLQGLIGTLAGLIAVIVPGITALGLVFVIAGCRARTLVAPPE